MNAIRQTFTVIGAFAAALFGPRFAHAQNLEEVPPGLQRTIAQAAFKHKQPGIAAALVTADGTFESAVFGKRSQAADAATVVTGDRFHVGSCTKAMTATLAAVLVSDGAIKWETTLAESFPQLEGMNDAFRSVTLEQLLKHRGGIAAYTQPDNQSMKILQALKGTPREQRRAFANTILAMPPAAPVGSFLYSNAGYGVAAAMLEQAADMDYETLMKQRLFDPLGMSSAGFGWPATKERPDQPLGHAPFGDGKLMTHPVGFFYKLEPALAPSGDAHMSVEDFARFLHFHLAGLRGVPIRGLALSKDAFERLHTPAGGEGDGSDYACGWVVIKGPRGSLHWHNGSAGTFFSLMAMNTVSNRGFVGMTNAGTGEEALEELMRESLSPTQPEQPKPPEQPAR